MGHPGADAWNGFKTHKYSVYVHTKSNHNACTNHVYLPYYKNTMPGEGNDKLLCATLKSLQGEHNHHDDEGNISSMRMRVRSD